MTLGITHCTCCQVRDRPSPFQGCGKNVVTTCWGIKGQLIKARASDAVLAVFGQPLLSGRTSIGSK